MSYGDTIYATHHIHNVHTKYIFSKNTPYMFFTKTPYIRPDRGDQDSCVVNRRRRYGASALLHSTNRDQDDNINATNSNNNNNNNNNNSYSQSLELSVSTGGSSALHWMKKMTR